MKLVLIGNRFINLEHITTAELIPTANHFMGQAKAAVRFDMLDYTGYLYGAEADTLWAALTDAWKEQ